MFYLTNHCVASSIKSRLRCTILALFTAIQNKGLEIVKGQSATCFAALLLPLLALPAAALANQAPTGYRAFMAARPELRQAEAVHWPVDHALLARVNAEVNALPYRADPEGRDLWGENQDCEEYVIAKLELLLAAGVPRGAMRMLSIEERGVGHLVLLVGNAMVLDNAAEVPRPLPRYGARGAWMEALDGSEAWVHVRLISGLILAAQNMPRMAPSPTVGGFVRYQRMEDVPAELRRYQYRGGVR
jgi:predicted transglutaminase-like cysteine proteinase